MAAPGHTLTVDDVLDLPLPNGVRGFEFVDGQPVPVMLCSVSHGRLIVDVGRRLANWVADQKLAGEVLADAGFILGLDRDRDRMRGPDIAYVPKERLAGADPERFFRGIPDLAIEIDLESGHKPDPRQRILDYLEAAVRLVWAIEPRSRTAMVYRPDGSARLLREDGVLDGEDVVPGFTVPLRELFG